MYNEDIMERLRKAEAERDSLRKAVQRCADYGQQLAAMYDAVMTEAAHKLPINDAYRLADASARVEKKAFVLLDAVKYFAQVKYNFIEGADDTKIAAALSGLPAQAGVKP